MRHARITGVDRASLVAWPFAWALLYYALTVAAVWGREVHPIKAMFLVFGMMITGLIALAAACIWLGLLARRERLASASKLTLGEVIIFGAVGGAAPMAAVVGLYELLYVDGPGAVATLGLVASAGVAGALSSIGMSGIGAFLVRVRARRNPPTSAGTT